MNEWVLWPWGRAFVRLTAAEAAMILSRGLDPGPVGQPVVPPMADEPLLTSAQVAERLNVTPEFVEVQVKTGAWPGLRLGRKYLRLRYSAVLAAIAANGAREP